MKIPSTITNSFGAGQVTVDGSNYSVPQYTKWNDGSGHSFAAITPQVYNYLNYGFTAWADGSTSQSRSITAARSQFGTGYTANFSVSSPQRVTNFTAGGSNGSNPHLSWTTHGNSDVDYYVYRKVRHNGVTGPEELLATLSHGTTSYDDPDWVLVGLSTYLLYYDVRAHHVPSGTFADPFWLCAGYGQLDRQNGPENPPSQLTQSGGKPDLYTLTAHPNPFNPATTIQFALPSDGHAKLTVLDMLGREVALLANGYYSAGYHSLTWNASDFASGIYLVHLNVIDELGRVRFSKVQKLLLAK